MVRWEAVIGMMGGIALVSAVAGGEASADVFCKKKKGPVLVRAGSTCKGTETVLDLSSFGAKGDKGDPGNAGPPGPFPTTLPSGKTLTGTFGLAGGKIGGGGDDFANDTISFAYPLAQVPTVHFIKNGDPVPAGCTGGTAAAPKADAGHLCVFEGSTSGASGQGTCSLTQNVCDQDTTDSAKYGTTVRAFGTGSRWYSTGSWAVTAP